MPGIWSQVRWMVYFMENVMTVDENWGCPYFRKAPDMDSYSIYRYVYRYISYGHLWTMFCMFLSCFTSTVSLGPTFGQSFSGRRAWELPQQGEDPQSQVGENKPHGVLLLTIEFGDYTIHCLGPVRGIEP